MLLNHLHFSLKYHLIMSFTNILTPPHSSLLDEVQDCGLPGMGKIKNELKVGLGLGGRNGVRARIE